MKVFHWEIANVIANAKMVYHIDNSGIGSLNKCLETVQKLLNIFPGQWNGFSQNEGIL